MIELDFLTDVRTVYFTLTIDRVAVAERLFHPPLELVSLHGTPPAFAKNLFASDCPRAVGTRDDYVSLITRTQEATATNPK